jgi:hypothetical protein
MARNPLFLSPSMYIFRKSVAEGILGHSRVWKAIGFFMIGRRMLRRIMGSDPRTVGIERLAPGETLILRGVTARRAKRR